MPESVVVCVLSTPVASFFAFTVAPATTAPFESWTEPVMFEVPVCATEVAALNRTTQHKQVTRTVNLNIGTSRKCRASYAGDATIEMNWLTPKRLSTSNQDFDFHDARS